MATARQYSRWILKDATLHPPALSPDGDDGAAEIPWVLIDQHAYVAERRNATTAFSTTWDGKKIQVTFCLARPSQVSHFCVYCPGLEPTEFPLEPKILATERDLVLLRVIVSSKRDILSDMDYYIYRAAAGGAPPSLTRLPRPPSQYGFDSSQVGILRGGSGAYHRDQDRFILRRHRGTADDDFFLVAALCRRSLGDDTGEFVLCRYNSKLPTRWSIHKVLLDKEDQLRHGGCYFLHINSKVITIGGDAGTMGFVDLWRGILFCDVLKVEEGKPAPPLRYVRLPSPLQPSTVTGGDARLCQDIAVVQQGRMIKFVELRLLLKDSTKFSSHDRIAGFVSRAWSRVVSATYLEDLWAFNCTCYSSMIPVKNNPHFELLPKVLDDEAAPLPPFEGLDIYQPTLSLQDDDVIVYMMAKKKHEDEKAWVIALDMMDNTLHPVAEFAPERTGGIGFAFVHSRISKYLTGAPGRLKPCTRHDGPAANPARAGAPTGQRAWAGAPHAASLPSSQARAAHSTRARQAAVSPKACSNRCLHMGQAGCDNCGLLHPILKPMVTFSCTEPLWPKGYGSRS